jgi:membrane protein implicated in regulation of membrane protease activity
MNSNTNYRLGLFLLVLGIIIMFISAFYYLTGYLKIPVGFLSGLVISMIGYSIIKKRFEYVETEEE